MLSSYIFVVVSIRSGLSEVRFVHRLGRRVVAATTQVQILDRTIFSTQFTIGGDSEPC